jgi:hypothetical protein
VFAIKKHIRLFPKSQISCGFAPISLHVLGLWYFSRALEFSDSRFAFLIFRTTNNLLSYNVFLWFRDSSLEGGQLCLAGGVGFVLIRHRRKSERSSHILLFLKQHIHLFHKVHINGLVFLNLRTTNNVPRTTCFERKYRRWTKQGVGRFLSLAKPHTLYPLFLCYPRSANPSAARISCCSSSSISTCFTRCISKVLCFLYAFSPLEVLGLGIKTE